MQQAQNKQKIAISKMSIDVCSKKVTYPDSSAIVLNEDELQSTFFHCYLDICGLCIQTEES